MRWTKIKGGRGMESAGQGVAHVNKVVWLGLPEKVAFEITDVKCLGQCLAQSKHSKRQVRN